MARTGHKGATHAQLKDKAFNAIFSEAMMERVGGWLRKLGVKKRYRADALQELFLSAFRSFHTFNPYVSRPERWMNAVTVYGLAHTGYKKIQQRETLMSDVYDPGLDEVLDIPPEAYLERRETCDRVWEVIQAIDNAEYRTILVSHGLFEIPLANLAEQSGMPLSTAYQMRIQAFEAFRKEAKRRGIEFTKMP